MISIKIIDKIHVLSGGDEWRGRDKKMKWAFSNIWQKFTYELETDEEEGLGWSDERYYNSPTSRTSWRRRKRKEYGDQMRDFQTIDKIHVRAGDGSRGSDRMVQMTSMKKIDHVHVPPGDGWRGREEMIRRKVSKQLTNLTYRLKADKKDGMIIKLEVLQFTNFTYVLETEGDC